MDRKEQKEIACDIINLHLGLLANDPLARLTKDRQFTDLDECEIACEVFEQLDLLKVAGVAAIYQSWDGRRKWLRAQVGKKYVLIDSRNGELAEVGKTYFAPGEEVSIHPRKYKLLGGIPPHKPSSSGKIYVEVHGDSRLVYPGSAGLKFELKTECKECKGHGTVEANEDYPDGKLSHCDECEGTGVLPLSPCIVCGSVRRVGNEICDKCGAEGYFMDPIGTVHAPGDDPAKAYE